ncbi:MAG: lipocalin family protein [Gammaproteobacteria bacterium]
MKRVWNVCRVCSIVWIVFVGGCSFNAVALEPLKPVEYVDLDRFMGPWYVIASTPTFIDKESYNAIERYDLNKDGTIQTTFTFYKGGFDGPLKTYRPKGFVKPDGSNAVWGMQFIWPIKADYQIVYLDEGYSRVIVAREKRDLVWLMAREPSIPESEYRELMDRIIALGYDEASLRLTPQRWE